MPRGDRTGPAGAGPMTGRGAGLCAGNPVAGTLNPLRGGGGGRGPGGGGGRGGGSGGGSGGGRGWGAGGGGGRGGKGGGGWRHRHWFHATGLTGWQRAALAGGGDAPPSRMDFVPQIAPEQELEVLKRQARSLEQALDDLRGRIGRIETAAEEPKTR